MPGIVDHLWQSLGIAGIAGALAFLAHGNPAAVRLWTWRIAAAKFFVPFQILHSAGAWVGFPVPHTADAPPDVVLRALESATPFVAPSSWLPAAGTAIYLVPAALLGLSAVTLAFIHRRLTAERAHVLGEWLRFEQSPDDVPHGLGFWKGALFGAVTLCAVLGPLIAGAAHDQMRRLDLLDINSRSLRDAPINMRVAAGGMGRRVRVIADARRVVIRNANVQDLVAIVYGVSHFAVTSDQMMSTENAKESDYWLISPRYDLTITGVVHEPGQFDPYALRQAITRLLAQRFGFEIHVNGKCQPPCGKYGVPLTP